MVVGALIVVFLVFGLFLSMLSSSPHREQPDPKWNPDTEGVKIRY